MSPLNSLGRQIERHWREHRPKMVRDLERTGHLEQALEAAENLTICAEIEAIRNGMTPDQARERFRAEWAFLRDEEDVPVLATDPRTWRTPKETGETA
jgi:hypothetical protein